MPARHNPLPWPADYPDLSAPELAGVRRVLGSARLDDALPDAKTVEGMVRVARGEWTTTDAIADLHVRIAREEFRALAGVIDRGERAE